ncbi:unnamed protein product [Ceratitis capitata]|uniref:(Mediterranean fruit fly) hypothetical protein n=1 Tax=Ceratitis capitata TaxID=7213 RepID=A0A811VH97_CERCA|nr:unnamed protein product [Ceratitis capitata]
MYVRCAAHGDGQLRQSVKCSDASNYNSNTSNNNGKKKRSACSSNNDFNESLTKQGDSDVSSRQPTADSRQPTADGDRVQSKQSGYAVSAEAMIWICACLVSSCLSISLIYYCTDRFGTVFVLLLITVRRRLLYHCWTAAMVVERS